MTNIHSLTKISTTLAEQYTYATAPESYLQNELNNLAKTNPMLLNKPQTLLNMLVQSDVKYGTIPTDFFAHPHPENNMEIIENNYWNNPGLQKEYFFGVDDNKIIVGPVDTAEFYNVLPVKPVDPAEPMLPVKPVDPAEPVLPVKPVDPPEPSHLYQKIDDRMDLSKTYHGIFRYKRQDKFGPDQGLFNKKFSTVSDDNYPVNADRFFNMLEKNKYPVHYDTENGMRSIYLSEIIDHINTYFVNADVYIIDRSCNGLSCPNPHSRRAVGGGKRRRSNKKRTNRSKKRLYTRRY